METAAVFLKDDFRLYLRGGMKILENIRMNTFTVTPWEVKVSFRDWKTSFAEILPDKAGRPRKLQEV
jgi:hypothetical protein